MKKEKKTIKNKKTKMKTGSKRLVYALLFVIVTAIEVCIALFVKDDFIRPNLGDVLAVIWVYALVRIAIPEKIRLLPLYVFLFAALVEFTQYIHLVELLRLDHIPFFYVVMGSSFDWKDMLCYAAGCVPLALWELVRYFHLQKQNKMI
ncbi:MAG: DUF2809 domain-containing protein [Oscillospiraceae bacterium]|nr:DUF2809 domain-containing protein [Oscillospiraceae bacterium]